MTFEGRRFGVSNGITIQMGVKANCSGSVLLFAKMISPSPHHHSTQRVSTAMNTEVDEPAIHHIMHSSNDVIKHK
jgi:hypothetical protein